MGPVFIRTGRPKAPVIYNAGQKFEIGKAIQVMDGSDVTVIANGLLVAQSLLAAEALEAEGISVRVIDLHTIKPIDREAISRAAAETGAIVVAEEHLVDTGTGVRVAQVVAETHPCPMEFVGIQDVYAESGEPDELHGQVRPGGPRRGRRHSQGPVAKAVKWGAGPPGPTCRPLPLPTPSSIRARPATGL